MILSVVALVVTSIITVLSPVNYFIRPSFNVETKFVDPHTDLVEIKNTGWIQAKNVQVSIISRDESKITSSRCNEAGILAEENFTNNHSIKMPRLSENLLCQITLVTNSSVEKQNVFEVTVTADDTPAYVKLAESTATTPQSNPVLQIITSASFISILVGWSAFFFAMKWITGKYFW